MYQPSGFIPSELTINTYQDIEPFFQKLLEKELNNSEDLAGLITCYSEVISVFAEQNARAYIQMTCNTEDQKAVERHEIFATKIAPEVDKISNLVQKKIFECPLLKDLPQERYDCYKREIARDLELFREENIPIEAELSKLSSEYGQTAGKLMVTIDGQELTIPQAQVKLESPDREERKNAWVAIQKSRLTAKDKLNDILGQMVSKRHQVSLNTGYKNYRDYRHDSLHRFDYTVEDVLKFHDAIEEHIVPLLSQVAQKHRERLDLDKGDYRPWDTAAKGPKETPLKPFTKGEELLDKTKTIFSKLHPDFGDNLTAMQNAQLFDLDSRKGKAPGGYNYGLEVTGMPFIFMNAAGTHRDVITLMHEGGHAMHTFLTHDEPLFQYRNTPSEMAETASMSMELMSSTHWGEFYSEEDVKRARREHFEDIISVFPWVATVDAFQHWLYTNPDHDPSERDQKFTELSKRFSSGAVNWEGFEAEHGNTWQKQLHIFEVPFYYIEYAIAQLGAIQVYQNFCKDPKQGLQNYIRGLSLGSSKPLPQVWQAMDIEFNFDSHKLKELMDFIAEEWSQF